MGKRPPVNFITGDMALKLRETLNMNQSMFWKRLGATQSAGSRYETGRPLPTPIQELLFLIYILDDEAAHARLDALRKGDAKVPAH